MENSHDIVLIIIIGIIILLQIYVFWKNYRKIQDYKKTIKNVKDFNIVEVSVPEEWIKEIEIDEILKDPSAFQKLVENFDPKINLPTEAINNSWKNINGEIEFPEDEGHEENGSTKESGYSKKSEEVEEDEEYLGPFKSIREKIKNILE